jgi:hypothetical protein
LAFRFPGGELQIAARHGARQLPSIRRRARMFEIVGNHRLMRRKRARCGSARGDESRRHAFVKRNALPKHVSAIGRA